MESIYQKDDVSMNMMFFNIKAVCTQIFTASCLGDVLTIFIRTRNYNFVVEVSLFANLKTLWIVAVTMSMLSYLQEKMYMVKGTLFTFIAVMM